MQWIEFNGIRSSELGLLVTSMPSENRAAMRYSTQSPYGIDGDLVHVDPWYGNYSTSVSFNCMGKATQNDVYKWLRGSGYMITSDHPDKHRWVTFADEQTDDRQRFAHRNFDTITVPIICAPFKTLIDEQPIIITASGANICSGIDDFGDVPAYPLIEMNVSDRYARDTITINGVTIGIVRFDPPYEEIPLVPDNLSIDCETKYSYVVDDGEIKSSYEYGLNAETSIGKYGTEWFSLEEGKENKIVYTAGISAIKIYPRWRWF